MDRRAGGIVGIEHRLNRAPAHVVRDDTSRDALTGHVGERQIHELRGVGAALADEVIVEPLACDPLELAEQVQLGFFSRIAPLRLQQPLRQVKQQSRSPQIAGVHEVEIHPFADDALVAGDGGADEVWGQHQCRIGGEGRLQALLRQLDAVAGDAREADFAGIALRRDGLDLYGLAGRLWRCDHGLRREVEGDAEHVGIFDGEHAVIVQLVGLPAQ